MITEYRPRYAEGYAKKPPNPTDTEDSGFLDFDSFASLKRKSL